MTVWRLERARKVSFERDVTPEYLPLTTVPISLDGPRKVELYSERASNRDGGFERVRSGEGWVVRRRLVDLERGERDGGAIEG